MSVSGGSGGLGVTLPWGDQERHFRLGLGEWRKIEVRCNAGPEEIAARLAPSAEALDRGLGVIGATMVGLIGRYRVDDVREVILQGLLGGDAALGPVESARLVQAYVDERPLRENVLTAFAVVMASIDGMPAAKPRAPDAGEPDGQGRPGANSPTGGSTGARYTGAAPARASPRPKSTK